MKFQKMTYIGYPFSENVSLKTMGVTQDQFDEICNSPILHHLPFASYEECIKILEQSYE